MEILSSYAPFIQPASVVISAIGVAATIFWNSRVARRRTTFEMLLAEQTNPELLKFRSELLAAVKKGELNAHAGDESFYSSPASFFLVSTLNRNELTAVGIKGGTIDESIYKSYWARIYVRDWIRCKEAVVRRREVRNEPTMFEEFEKLALKWATPDEKLKFKLSNSSPLGEVDPAEK